MKKRIKTGKTIIHNQLGRKGFTLVEVLAVISLIALLGLIAAPNVINTIKNSKQGSYNVMVNDIKTAGEELYTELDYAGSSLYDYNIDGSKGGLLKISSNSVTVTLQGLVSNGFLRGANNPNKDGSNKNSKVILNSKTDADIGACQIIITKTKTNNITSYVITSNSSDENCPTTEEYK